MRNLIVAALLFCVPVALFANTDAANVKADTNIVMNHDFDQAIDNNIAPTNNDEVNLDEGASDSHRRWGWGRGWGRGWGYGGGWGYGNWGWGGSYWPWYGYSSLYYPYWNLGWGW